VTSSGSKRDENSLRSNDPTIAYFLDDNDINNAHCILNLPISVLPEWNSPRVNMKIEGETLPVLLDTGAEISAVTKKIMEKFVDCSTLNTHRRCQTFGGYVLTIKGPCYLNDEVCGYKLNHPFYVLDGVNASAPIVAEIDLMSAVEMENDLKDCCVWSRRTRSSVDSSESTNSARQASSQKESMLPDKRTSSVRHAIDASDVAAATAAFDVSRMQSSHACNRKKRDARSPRCISEPTSSHIFEGQDNKIPDKDDRTQTQVKVMDTDADDLPAHIHLLYAQTIDENHLKSEVARNLKQLLRTHTETFAKSTGDLGFCSLLKHNIDTGDARPMKQSPRRPPLAACDSENQILDEMLATGVIEPSN